MLITPSPYLIEKQETSSAGALQKNYNKLFSLIPLHEGKQSFNRISLPFALSKLTDDTLTTGLEEFLQSLARQNQISRNTLQNEAIREIFSHRGSVNFQYLQEVGTSAVPSVRILPLHNLPFEVKECFNKLFHREESESGLYSFSDAVAEWLIEAPEEYHIFFSAYLQTMPSISSRILLSSLNDAEFSTNTESLLKSVSLLLKSDDKRLAQTAAAFLINCGGSMGRSILQEVISTEKLPYSELIQGINKILS